jgi:hypothetical protein
MSMTIDLNRMGRGWAFGGEALNRALDGLSVANKLVVLRALKEAAIYDQNFDDAAALREAEKLLTRGVTKINPKRRRCAAG